MAGTLLSAPTLGDSDWSAWITLVDACRRGYLAASYTNFAASAESALAAGSLVEVAGAVYSFTETAIDYTGGGSANSDLYIYVVPSAAVSTCTVVAWGSAPVWVDAKQGFYASAASTTRCIGGIYVAGVGSYANKYFYLDEFLNYCLLTNVTRPILKKSVSIGDWNMDTDSIAAITHSLIKEKIRSVNIIIRDDAGTQHYPDSLADAATGIKQFWPAAITNTQISMRRLSSGTFDGVSYDATSYNRGWVYIEYEA